MASLKELTRRESKLAPGHRACSGCGSLLTVKQVLMAIDEPVVCSMATGCIEVSTTIYPYTAWRVPFFHNAFENSAATLSGTETMYRVLKKKGKITKDIRFVAFGGDGGTYDIGLQSLSGAMERGHDLLYVCYDNEAYMNTGIQRSSATPIGAATSTSPVGGVIPGKKQHNKNLTKIMVAHEIPYVAQTSSFKWADLQKKVQKAMSIHGPKFINVLSSCHRGWRLTEDESLEVLKMAVETRFWPLYEVEYGKYTLNYKPKKYVPIEEWLKVQGRFKHLLKEENKPIVEAFQKRIDERWEELLTLSGEKQ